MTEEEIILMVLQDRIWAARKSGDIHLSLMWLNDKDIETYLNQPDYYIYILKDRLWTTVSKYIRVPFGIYDTFNLKGVACGKIKSEYWIR